LPRRGPAAGHRVYTRAAAGTLEAGILQLPLFYSDLDRDQLEERISEAGRDWDAIDDEVSQVMREFYDRQ